MQEEEEEEEEEDSVEMMGEKALRNRNCENML